MRQISGRSSTSSSDTAGKQIAGWRQSMRNPGRVNTATSFGSFASKARSHPPPHAQRQQFDILLTAIDDTVQQYRSAQAALSSGNTDAYQAALTQADHTMVKASTAAQRYGNAASRGLRQGTRAGRSRALLLLSLAGGWRLGGDSPLAVQGGGCGGAGWPGFGVGRWFDRPG